MKKKTKSRMMFEILNHLIMIFLVIVTLYPVIYILLASFSEPMRIITYNGILLKPLGFSLASYEKAFMHPLIFSSYLNTIIIVVVGVLVNIVLTAIGAYLISRKDLLFKRVISFAIIFTMYFSGGLIPMYFTVRDLGLYNTIWALILPVAINTFNLMIMRTGFEAIPESLEESAKLDGAGHFTVLFKIIIPLAMPTVAVMILYYGVSHWNSWFNASLYIKDPEKYPLQLVLRQILLANNTESMTSGLDDGTGFAISETIKYSIIVIATAPILCIYPFLQKYFVKGIMIGAVKG